MSCCGVRGGAMRGRGLLHEGLKTLAGVRAPGGLGAVQFMEPGATVVCGLGVGSLPVAVGALPVRTSVCDGRGRSALWPRPRDDADADGFKKGLRLMSTVFGRWRRVRSAMGRRRGELRQRRGYTIRGGVILASSARCDAPAFEVKSSYSRARTLGCSE